MGGSSSGGNGGTPPRPRCEGPFRFIVLTNNLQIWNFVNVGDTVYINTLNNPNLPKLEVRIKGNDLLIGLVSANYTGVLLTCIEEGWNYEGEVNRKDGDLNNPEIEVKIWGW